MARTWKIWLLPMLLTVASHASPHDAWTGFDATGFRLVTSDESCFLHRGEEEPIPVPRDWLFPPDEVRAEGDLLGYVTAFEWLPEVTAFPVGDGRVGLHLSSYAIQESGSARAAAGRDLFLIWDPASDRPLRRGFDVAKSKGRVRLGGCFQAYHHRFFAGDVDCDRRLDLGVKEERTDCRAKGDVGPLYAHHYVGPLRWHTLTDSGWEHQEALDRRLPCRGMRELPLPGLAMSPVDFALSLFESQPPLPADSSPSPLPPRYTFETEPARHDGPPRPPSRLVVRTADGPREHTFPTGASIWRDESANGYLIITFIDRKFSGFATSGYDYVDLDSGRRSPVLRGLIYEARLVPKDLLVAVRRVATESTPLARRRPGEDYEDSVSELVVVFFEPSRRRWHTVPVRTAPWLPDDNQPWPPGQPPPRLVYVEDRVLFVATDATGKAFEQFSLDELKPWP